MNYLFFVVILASVFTACFAISCHQCQTLAENECNDHYIVDTQDDCDDDHYCVKYKTIVKLRDSGYINGWERKSSVVTRSCEPKEGKSEGCIGWQNNGGVTIKCWCGTDGCNTGHSTVPTKTFVFVSCLTSLLAYLCVSRH